MLCVATNLLCITICDSAFSSSVCTNDTCSSWKLSTSSERSSRINAFLHFEKAANGKKYLVRRHFQNQKVYELYRMIIDRTVQCHHVQRKVFIFDSNIDISTSVDQHFRYSLAVWCKP